VAQEFQKLVKELNFSKYFFRFYCWVTKALIIRAPLSLAAPMTVGTANCSTWQEVFLQTFLSFLTELSNESPAAEDETRVIFQQEFSQYASEYFTILLSPLVSEEKTGKSSEENKTTEKMKPVEVENELNKEQSLQIMSAKLFSKENHGNASLFWNQKLFSVVLPFLSNAILPPPAPVAATPTTSFASPFTQRMTSSAPLLSTSSSIVDEKTFNRKFLHYMFLCQLISLSPSSIRKLNISPLFDCFKMILTACSQMERVSSTSSSLSSSLTAISLLERELFPSLELLIQENPALFGDSLHLIIPRLTKVTTIHLFYFFSDF
jgi:hypothetical protein